jgi:hypothetical protein
MLIHQEGVFLSSDFRITAGARIVRDDLWKMLHVRFAPVDTGPDILMAFTGLAQVRGVGTLQWIRDTLRGYQYTWEQGFEALRARLERDVCQSVHRRIGLLLTGIARNKDGSTAFFEITNVDPVTWLGQPTARIAVHNLGPGFGAVGSGASFVSPQDQEKARRLGKTRPRAWHEYASLLAAINRRASHANLIAAQANPQLPVGVSPWSVCGYLVGEGAKIGVYQEPWETPIESPMPALFSGIDYTESSQLLVDMLAAHERGKDISGLEREYRQALLRGTKPKD